MHQLTDRPGEASRSVKLLDLIYIRNVLNNSNNLCLPATNIVNFFKINNSVIEAFTVDHITTSNRDDAISLHDFNDKDNNASSIVGIHITDLTTEIYSEKSLNVCDKLYGCYSLFLKIDYNRSSGLNEISEMLHRKIGVKISRNYTYCEFDRDPIYTKLNKLLNELNSQEVIKSLMVTYNIYFTHKYHYANLIFTIKKNRKEKVYYDTRKGLHCDMLGYYAYFTSPSRSPQAKDNQLAMSQIYESLSQSDT
jgi:hypothetical protein